MTEVRRKSLRPDWTQSVILGDRGVAARHYADLVAERFTGSVLTYSARKALLVHAQLRGIGRFEANLIIAAVQHRVRPAGQRASKPIKPVRMRRRFTFGRFPVGIATFLGVQTLIGIAVWRIFG